MGSFPNLSVDTVEVVAIRHRRVILKGKCGQQFRLLVDDWPKMRTRIERAVRIARKQKLSRIELQAKAMQDATNAGLVPPLNQEGG